MSVMRVTAVVATKNSERTVSRCISSLIHFVETGSISRVVLVDGGSTDHTLGIVSQYPVTLLSDEGRGFFAAYDLGWKGSSDELVLFIDSDAFLGTEFFPRALEFFSDAHTGMLVTEARAVVTNRLTKIIGEWWDYRSTALGKDMDHEHPGWLERQYQRFVLFSDMQLAVSGPCYMIRRRCLEQVDGFPEDGDDFILGKIISDKGWAIRWWSTSQVYHHTRSDLNGLMREYFRFGFRGSLISRRYFGFSTIIVRLLTLSAAPILALSISMKFNEPLHLVILPLTRFVEAIGFLVGLASSSGPYQGRIPR